MRRRQFFKTVFGAGVVAAATVSGASTVLAATQPKPVSVPTECGQFTKRLISLMKTVMKRMQGKPQERPFDVSGSIDFMLEHCKDARWDVMARAHDIMEQEFTRKMNSQVSALMNSVASGDQDATQTLAEGLSKPLRMGVLSGDIIDGVYECVKTPKYEVVEFPLDLCMPVGAGERLSERARQRLEEDISKQLVDVAEPVDAGGLNPPGGNPV